jgi:hypothetical protein
MNDNSNNPNDRGGAAWVLCLAVDGRTWLAFLRLGSTESES